MDSPEFILVDVFGTKNADDQLISGILYEVKEALNLDVLNYQYGYVTELNETLKQWSDTKTFSELKFPLVWLAQPFTISRGKLGFYGSVDDLRIFIINETTPDLKATQRMEGNYKTVIYPIYRELMNQLAIHPAFSNPTSGIMTTPQTFQHNFTDRYYWGEAQQSVLNDVVDCSEISGLKIDIHHNHNCIPFKNF